MMSGGVWALDPSLWLSKSAAVRLAPSPKPVPLCLLASGFQSKSVLIASRCAETLSWPPVSVPRLPWRVAAAVCT